MTESEFLMDNSWVALSPGMERLAVATRSGPIYLVDLEGKGRAVSLAGLASDSQLVEFSPNGKLLAAAAPGKGLRVWNLDNLEVLATLPKSDASPPWPGLCGLCFTTNSESVAIGNSDGTVEVWNLARKELATKWRARDGLITGTAFMPNGNRLVTISDEGRLWDVESQPELVSPGQVWSGGLSVAVSPDGQRIAVGTADGLIKISSPTDGQQLVALKGVNDWVDPDSHDRWRLQYVTGLAFLPPDGNTLISFTGWVMGCEARLWRAPSWEEIEAAEARERKEAEVQGPTR